MSELVIRSGGAVDVDTGSLRAVAVELEGIAGEAADIGADLGAATAVVHEAGPETLDAQWYLTELLVRVRRAGDDAADLARRVRVVAEQYEAVELYAEREIALARGDEAAVRRLDRALDAIPLPARAAAVHALTAPPDPGALDDQVLWGALVLGSPATLLLPAGVRALSRGLQWMGRGRVGADDRLTGAAVPVSVRPVAATAPATAPAGLADVASRIPGGGAARVRVERYEMPSGRREYAVYIAGTQSFDGDDAFDARSSVELYAGEHSAAYDATIEALRQAGAEPGDTVHAFGHSQGAMIGERLATESAFRVETTGSFGSPVQVDVPEHTLAVSLRHTDDPVAALQAGGHANGVGAPASFIVERLADPLPGLHDLTVPAHHMDAYTETARLVDASDDPRVGALREVFDAWGRAESVRVTEYSAERISPATSGAG